MTDRDLVKAGRAGRAAECEVLDTYVREGIRSRNNQAIEESYEAVARAVLASLGIEWEGDHVWRVGWGEGTEGDWSGTFSTEDEARKHVAEWSATRLQRRPKLTVEWQDVT